MRGGCGRLALLAVLASVAQHSCLGDVNGTAAGGVAKVHVVFSNHLGE